MSPKNLVSKCLMLYQSESSHDHEKSGDREGFEPFSENEPPRDGRENRGSVRNQIDLYRTESVQQPEINEVTHGTRKHAKVHDGEQ